MGRRHRVPRPNVRVYTHVGCIGCSAGCLVLMALPVLLVVLAFVFA